MEASYVTLSAVTWTSPPGGSAGARGDARREERRGETGERASPREARPAGRARRGGGASPGRGFYLPAPRPEH